jgi:hypothetical protein
VKDGLPKKNEKGCRGSDQQAASNVCTQPSVSRGYRWGWEEGEGRGMDVRVVHFSKCEESHHLRNYSRQEGGFLIGFYCQGPDIFFCFLTVTFFPDFFQTGTNDKRG